MRNILNLNKDWLFQKGTPGGIAAVVVRNAFAVHKEICGGVRAAKFHIVQIRLGERCTLKGLFVKAAAAEVIVSAVLPIRGVPGVGEVNALAPGAAHVCRALLEEPILV